MDPKDMPQDTSATDEQDSRLLKFGITVFLLLVVFGLAYYIYYGMNNTPATVIEEQGVAENEVTEELTIEEKKDILDSLRSDDEGEPLSNDEKRAVLSELQAVAETDEAEELTIEEKQAVLDSLRAAE